MIFVDAHVHIYDCFKLQAFLDSAFANFKAEATRLRQEETFTAVLLLTEGSKENWFQRLASYADDEKTYFGPDLGNWTFRRTSEPCSLWVERNQDQGFFVVAGRQIVTLEDLEVLCLASEKQFEDGSPLEMAIQAVTQSDAIPVIPWGFGKWTGRRSKTLERTLLEIDNSKLFLGDNGGRPSFWPRPAHFELALSRDIRVLPGSDPLPFASETGRAGSFGFSVEGLVSAEEPARDIKRILLDAEARPLAYGKLESPFRFFFNQLRMQLKKKLNKRAKNS
jgi:hypothetical protein